MTVPPIAIHAWPVGGYMATLMLRQDRTTFVEWSPAVPTFLWREELAQFYAGRMEGLAVLAERWPGVAFSLHDPVVERLAELYDRRGV